jgi:small subunit ribosomal protein S8
MVTDPIADLLTRMRNAFSANQEKTVVPYSKMNFAILQVLKKYRFIDDLKKIDEGSFQKILIDFNVERSGLNLKRISKPGQRIYFKNTEIKPIRNGYGISIFSTPQGVMSGHTARSAGIGGEFLCEVW